MSTRFSLAGYFRGIVWLLRLQWRTSKSYFAWVVFDSLFGGLQPLAVAYVAAQFIATLAAIALDPGSVDTSLAYWWLAALLGLGLMSRIISQAGRLIEVRSEDRMRVAAGAKFATKLYQLNQSQFDDPGFNTKVGRAREALRQLRQMTWRVPQNISALVRFVGAFWAIFWIEPALAAVFVLAVIPEICVGTVTNRWHEQSRRRSEHDQRIASRSEWFLFDPRNMAEVRLVNAFRRLLASWQRHQQTADRVEFDSHRRAAPIELSVATIVLLVEFAAVVYIVGQLIGGQIGFDQAIFLRGLIEAMTFSSGLLANSARFLHQTSIDLQNLDQVNQTPPAIPDGRIRPRPPLAIRFDRVSFRYPAGTSPALRDVSFRLDPGQKLALVGRNGAGKTTIVNLLLRQYLPTDGEIRVNDRRLADLSQAAYQAQASVLSQEFLLFEHLTIGENLIISLGRRPSEAKIHRVLELVGLSRFVKSLPGGLDTRLTPSFDGGVELSAGQRQRLGVARALLAEADLLVLDEPTSAVDAPGEQLIFDNIYRQYSARTVLIVSHRFSTVRRADTILVVDRGRIADRGSHRELMARDGLYRQMFELQAAGYR